MRVEWAGEELVLLPERAVWWGREATLFVADLHFGKAAAFRHAGLPVPGGTTAADLVKLDSLVERWGAHRLVVLGDLIHAPTGRAAEMMAAVAQWCARRGDVEKVLVRGNHDRRSGDPPGSWGMASVDGPFAMGPFTLVHEPGEKPRAGRFVMGGHLHPAVVLRRADGRAGGIRAACFWMRGGGSLILPGFGAFTGMKAVRPRVGDRVFAVGPREVVEVVGEPAA